MDKIVTGLFTDPNDVDAAVAELEEAGFGSDDISVIVEESVANQKFRNREETKAENVAEGAVSGGTTGGIIGGIVGLIAGLTPIAIPGLGALLIGGPLAAALGLTGAAATAVSGAVTGALAGGLIGALSGLGIPEEEARRIEERVKAGDIMVGVSTSDEDESSARKILEDNGAEEVSSYNLNR